MTPGPNQYRLLLALGSGASALSISRRRCEPMLRRGWVTAELRGRYYQMVRITPAGLHALADGADKYGLPDWKTGALLGPSQAKIDVTA